MSKSSKFLIIVMTIAVIFSLFIILMSAFNSSLNNSNSINPQQEASPF
jgi:hypothetical protein